MSCEVRPGESLPTTRSRHRFGESHGATLWYMIRKLTRHPVVRKIGEGAAGVKDQAIELLRHGNKRGLAFKIFLFALLFGLGLLFYGTLLDFQERSAALRAEGSAESLNRLPSVFPPIWQGLGVFLALVAFLVSLWIRGQESVAGRKGTLMVLALWIAAFAALIAWLPSDVLATKEAISGKAIAGETPSIPAYLGKLFLITLLILSIPAAAMLYFRLELMDRYVVHSFLSPFSFCLFSFIAIWVIADLTNNGSAFTGLPLGRVLTFYVVQVPHVVLFVMPIVVLLSALFALSKMSKANELISMIGSGRSVLRILTPLLILGAYSSVVCLAFKYEWAPASVGYKDAIIETASRESWAKKHGKKVKQDIWAKRGWLHVNEPDRRTWFVGKVPFRLSDDMADVVVWQLGEDGHPDTIWKAKRARWIWDSDPPTWVLMGTKVYEYDENHIPRVREHSGKLTIDSWSETPWKVLSSSQNPEYLGIPGLTMYLEANAGMDPNNLAPFRTNWWYVFAEPLACLAMILVAAPLGIVYSRRGVMAGVTGAVAVFALMYVMRGTFLALGHRNTLGPFMAAWLTNFIVAGIGIFLLWFRARNREIPKPKELLASLFGRTKQAA